MNQLYVMENQYYPHINRKEDSETYNKLPSRGDQMSSPIAIPMYMSSTPTLTSTPIDKLITKHPTTTPSNHKQLVDTVSIACNTNTYIETSKKDHNY